MRLPAALAPFSDPVRIRTPWPLLLGAGEPRPLAELLQGLVGDLRASLLADNLPRLELAIRQGQEDHCRERVRAAAERMRAALALREAPDAQLRDELDSLLALLPAGRLLDFGPRAALALFQAAARQRVLPLRGALDAELSATRGELRRRLEVERRHEEPSAGLLGVNVGALGARRGTVGMSPERRRRLEALEGSLRLEGPPFIVAQTSDCEGAAATFDEAAAELVRALGVLRAARLELAGAWDEERHRPLLEAFTWRDLGPEEATLLPVVLLVRSADALAGPELAALTRLLTSGRPVQLLAEQTPTRNPGLGQDEDPLSGHRVELGMLAMGLGTAFVQQSTPARQAHLWSGFQKALDGGGPGLHLVFSGSFDGQLPSVGAWLAASAAVESRALPLFHFDPSAGSSWAATTDVSGNPCPEDDWAGEEQPFTFVDYALLDPALAHHFAEAPEGQVQSTQGTLSPSAALRTAAQDRLGTWHRLRELGGVANEHARRAAEAARKQAQEQADSAREAQAAEHDQALEEIRANTAREAIKRLASALVDGQLGAPVARPPQRAVTAPAPPVSEAPAPASTPEPTPQEAEDEEAWVDSDLCTSCNDCVVINPQLFVYDSNKQIELGDLSTGTYAELKLAAEKCPANCIHPGSPPA